MRCRTNSATPPTSLSCAGRKQGAGLPGCVTRPFASEAVDHVVLRRDERTGFGRRAGRCCFSQSIFGRAKLVAAQLPVIDRRLGSCSKRATSSPERVSDQMMQGWSVWKPLSRTPRCGCGRKAQRRDFAACHVCFAQHVANGLDRRLVPVLRLLLGPSWLGIGRRIGLVRGAGAFAVPLEQRRLDVGRPDVDAEKIPPLARLYCGTVLRQLAALAQAAKGKAATGVGSIASRDMVCSSLTLAGVLYPCRATSQVSL